MKKNQILYHDHHSVNQYKVNPIHDDCLSRQILITEPPAQSKIYVNYNKPNQYYISNNITYRTVKQVKKSPQPDGIIRNFRDNCSFYVSKNNPIQKKSKIIQNKSTGIKKLNNDRKNLKQNIYKKPVAAKINNITKKNLTSRNTNYNNKNVYSKSSYYEPIGITKVISQKTVFDPYYQQPKIIRITETIPFNNAFDYNILDIEDNCNSERISMDYLKDKTFNIINNNIKNDKRNYYNICNNKRNSEYSNYNNIMPFNNEIKIRKIKVSKNIDDANINFHNTSYGCYSNKNNFNKENIIESRQRFNSEKRTKKNIDKIIEIKPEKYYQSKHPPFTKRHSKSPQNRYKSYKFQYNPKKYNVNIEIPKSSLNHGPIILYEYGNNNYIPQSKIENEYRNHFQKNLKNIHEAETKNPKNKREIKIRNYTYTDQFFYTSEEKKQKKFSTSATKQTSRSSNYTLKNEELESNNKKIKFYEIGKKNNLELVRSKNNFHLVSLAPAKRNENIVNNFRKNENTNKLRSKSKKNSNIQEQNHQLENIDLDESTDQEKIRNSNAENININNVKVLKYFSYFGDEDNI